MNLATFHCGQREIEEGIWGEQRLKILLLKCKKNRLGADLAQGGTFFSVLPTLL
jgi:hypothetical protein